jgi:hypothetical protein
MRAAAPTAAAVAFLALAPAAGAAAKRPPCTLSTPTRTIESTRYARVFERRKHTDNPDPIFACLYSANRVRRIGTDDCFDSEAVGDLRIAGRFVGYSIQTCGISEGSDRVRVMDLRRGRLRTSVSATNTAGHPDSFVVTDLELRPTGAVGWIVELFSEPAHTWEVRKVGRDRLNTLLDSGAGISPHSLALSGHFLYWIRDRASYFTRLD